jgi:hypothetical protein
LADEDFPREDDLASRQNAALYPVGRVLRQTYDAENHDSLGNDLTGLMLELAHIEPDGAPLPRGAVPIPAAKPRAAPSIPAAPVASPAGPVIAQPALSWWRAALERLLAR